MSSGGQLRQRGERLALASAGETGDARRVKKVSFGCANKRSRTERKLAGLHPKPHALAHPEAKRHDSAAAFERDFGKLAKAMKMRGKRGQEKAPLRARHDFAHNGLERTFGSRAPRALDVGRIRKQERDPFAPQLGKPLTIEMFAVDRRFVDLEVSAVNDQAGWRPDSERERIGRGMRNANRLDFEGTEAEGTAWPDGYQLRLPGKRAFGKPAARERKRHVARVNRDIDFAQQMRERADVIFVRMGEDDTLETSSASVQPGEVRDEHPFAIFGMLGEHHSAIDYDRAASRFDGQQVEPDFTQPAERDNPDRSDCGRAIRHHLTRPATAPPRII